MAVDEAVEGMPNRILLVESDTMLRRSLVVPLEEAGFEISAVSEAETALSAFSLEPHDGVVIDLELPGNVGIALRTALRRESPAVPILLLSPVGREIEGLGGLSGADDFMTSPYRARDLILRLRMLLRLANEAAHENVLHAGEIALDLERREMKLGGAPVKLTTKEFDLLRELIEARGRILRREQLMERIWGYTKDSGVETRTLDVHIRRLREKLSGEGRRILTLRNVGYRLDMAAENLRTAENLRAAEKLRMSGA